VGLRVLSSCRPEAAGSAATRCAEPSTLASCLPPALMRTRIRHSQAHAHPTVHRQGCSPIAHPRVRIHVAGAHRHIMHVPSRNDIFGICRERRVPPKLHTSSTQPHLPHCRTSRPRRARFDHLLITCWVEVAGSDALGQTDTCMLSRSDRSKTNSPSCTPQNCQMAGCRDSHFRMASIR